LTAMAQTLSLTALSVVSPRLAQCIARVTENLEVGKPIDLRELCADCPECLEQLETLLPTLEAIVGLGHSAFDNIADEPDETSIVSGSPDPAHPASNRGLLGDFRILRELGRGGMGVVYEAEQLSIGRRVALKVLPFAAMLDRQQLNRFKNEARAAGTLDHPNIVAIHSVGCERGVHYYAMQLIEGRSLAEIIAAMKPGRSPSVDNSALTASLQPMANDTAKAALPTIQDRGSAAFSTLDAPGSSLPAFSSREYFRTIARLGIQAAEALDHAHQNGILHRDIKPANLLVEYGDSPGTIAAMVVRSPRSKMGLPPSDGYPKLWITDFGLARIEQDAGMTMTGDLLGTLRYMSPEQALAKRVVVDHRCDIYSLGVTLYELLTLQPAYDAADRQELLRQIAFDEPRKPRQINPHIPQDLETINLKAIEKNPVDRYLTAQDLANDLRRFLDDQPIKAKPQSLLVAARKWSRRHPAGVRATIISTLLAAVMISMSLGWISRDRAAQQTVLAEQVRLALDEANTWYEAGKLTEALSSVKRAEGLLAGGGGSNRLKRTVSQRRVDLETAQRIDQLRIDRADTRLRGQFADRTYGKLFQEYGIDLQALNNAEAAQRIQNSPIRHDLIAALHDWPLAGPLIGTYPEDVSQAKELLQIAQLADPDVWRTRLLDAIVQGNVSSLQQLAGDDESLDQDASTTNLFARALLVCRGPAEAAKYLEKVQRRRPGDFWLNVELASCLSAVNVEDSIVYYRIAIALRPGSPMSHLALGVLLGNGQKDADAESCFREAIRLDWHDPFAHLNLALSLAKQGKYDEADESCRNAMSLKSSDPYPYHWLGGFLMERGKYAQAAATFEQGIAAAASDRELKHLKNELAWLLSTAPLDEVRDGKRAIELATQACQISNNKDHRFLDTLAAAYAETGEFEAAIRWSNSAIERTTNNAYREEYAKHLEAFQSGKPWRVVATFKP
jgi:serine/threonine protein kinase/Flp pilus assembly protein TadD